jgi:hypothetical protein
MESSSSASSNASRNFLSYVNQIFDSIGIQSGETRNRLIEGLNKYNDNNKYLFLNNEELKRSFGNLLEADNRLNKLMVEGGVLYQYREKIGSLWGETINQLGKLQALAILQKINESDCSPVVDALLQALNQKIGIVNNLIESNLQETPKTKPQETRVEIPTKYLQNENASSSNVSSSNNASSSTVPNFILKNSTSNVPTGQPLRLGANLKSIANNQSAISNFGLQQNIANNQQSNSNIAGKKKYFAVGGSYNLYKAKYLKYKQKYLELKNNL